MDTVGGFVVRECGAVAARGDTIRLARYTARVLSVGPRQRSVVEVLITPDPEK